MSITDGCARSASDVRKQRRYFVQLSHCFLVVTVLLAGASPVRAGTPTQGTAYIATVSGIHNVYRIDYQYNGVDSFTIVPPDVLATLTTAADAVLVPSNALVVAGQGADASRIDLADGSYVTASTSNNGNVVVLDPDGQSVWFGWKDTCLSHVQLNPFGNATTHCTTGDDAVITMLAFTPANGIYYSTGGGSATGNLGRIDLQAFTTQRILTGVYATGVVFDPFSNSLVYSALGRATQVEPSDPTVVISSRNDGGGGENYLILRPDGLGHLFGTRSGGSGADAGRIVFIDYSESGRIGDATTHFFSEPLPGGLSGGVAAFQDGIFRQGFDPRSSP